MGLSLMLSRLRRFDFSIPAIPAFAFRIISLLPAASQSVGLESETKKVGTHLHDLSQEGSTRRFLVV
jgi:hypothetical protein